MKNITKSLIALFAVLAISCSSDDVEDRPVITAKDAPVLSAPEGNNSYVLAIENAASQAERFVWTSANYGQNVAINYEIQLDIAGNNFENARSLGSVTGANQLSVSVETLNGAATGAGGTPFEQGQFEVRVKASVNGTFEPLYSNVATITITPYIAIAPKLYFVGAPQAYYGLSGWSETTAIPMRYLGNGTTKVFEAYVKVAAGEGFKFVDTQSWANGNFGTIGGAQNGNLENGGGSGDIKVAETDGSGLYYIWVDIDNLKYKAIKMNWGIIGDATPNAWANETPMAYDFTTNTYSYAGALTAGEMKFRAKNVSQAIYNEDWKFAIGNSTEKFAYDTGASNFPIAAGSYTISLSIGFDGVATVTGL